MKHADSVGKLRALSAWALDCTYSNSSRMIVTKRSSMNARSIIPVVRQPSMKNMLMPHWLTQLVFDFFFPLPCAHVVAVKTVYRAGQQIKSPWTGDGPRGHGKILYKSSAVLLRSYFISPARTTYVLPSIVLFVWACLANKSWLKVLWANLA